MYLWILLLTVKANGTLNGESKRETLHLLLVHVTSSQPRSYAFFLLFRCCCRPLDP